MTISKHVKIGDCDLYLADFMEIHSELESADCVVTDPPYLIGSGGNAKEVMGGKFSRESYNNSGKIIACDIGWSEFMPLIYSSMKDPAHAYVMANNRNVQALLNSAEAAGLYFHNLLIWNKGSGTPNRWYMKNLEYTGFFSKGKAFAINDCGSMQLANVPNLKGQNHPTAKPVELMLHYIRNSTKAGETVLDPFMGGGATMAACAKSGRKGVGVEIDPDHFELACKTIHQAYSQKSLF